MIAKFWEVLSRLLSVPSRYREDEGYEPKSPKDHQMFFRIGINIGDVMVSKGNLFGDAVNVAARLESAAQPSGICISKQVFDLINQKLQVSFEDAGALKLKNITEPGLGLFRCSK
ncbi:MAG: hypothetical protein CM1200mP30_17560 [Pseudomonadota bacterium]|nr:MAG: hypothetical protein CM1200mP30_17560 [Pseudomonadota bacterium]